MASSVVALVQQLIKDNLVMVFSKSCCPYCTRAKEALTALGQAFHVVELDAMDNGADIQNQLEKLTGQRTVPNIFIKTKHIGGCSELLELKKTGELQKLLS